MDVFHGPNHFLPRFDSRRNVVTIHDVAYFKMEVHGATLDAVMREWTRHALSNAGRVIALSENTRRDVLELGMAPENVKVIYGGGNIVPEDRIAFSRLPEMRSSLDLPAKYILFIGALQPRKNVPFLVRAYAELRRRYGTDHELVLAGPKDGATGEILALCKELGVTDHVRLTGYLEDWQIPLLYKEAGLFVLPTRYEGFTLVTLEAMAYGTPLIATDSSSIREGVGDAGLLVPVDDVGRLAADMHSTLHDPLLRQQLIERGKVQSRKFTWQRCAEETLALYREIAIAPMPLELPT